MSQAFGASGKRRKPTINITSLIDVMFLLLIFFMVSSTFKDEEQTIDVTLPQAGTGATQDQEYREIVVTAEGEYRYEGDPVNGEELQSRIAELMASAPETLLALRADEAADWQPIVTAIDIMRQTGVKKMAIPTDRLEEAPAGP